MGQSASQPQRGTEERQSRRRSMLRRSVQLSPVDDGQDGLLRGEHSGLRRRRPDARAASTNRLSQMFLRPASRSDTLEMPAERPSRSRMSFRDMLSRRDSRHVASLDSLGPAHGLSQHRASYVRAGGHRDQTENQPPRHPEIDLSLAFENDLFSPREEPHAGHRQPPPSRRSNLRVNPFASDRPFRHFTSSLRRRRSPQPSRRSEDQAAMLSRLLSVAAAATAATLMGEDHQALSEAQSLTDGTGIGEMGFAGEDGSFDGFLRALQNGRIASALRNGGEPEGEDAAREGSLNFFRMFRFGALGAGPSPLSSGLGDPSEANDAGADGRMVPIIIVGIRSLNSGANSGSNSPSDDLPPFIDALGNFPNPLPANALDGHGHESIDSILRPPHNGTSFRHRRRASMGGFGMNRNRMSSTLADRLDDQRDHRSPERRRERQWSVGSGTSNFEPRPPPATPASPSPELSRLSSRNTTPNHSRPASFVANSVRDFGTDSRRNSALHRASVASPLSAHTEETSSLRSAHSSTNLLSPNGDPSPYRIQAHRRSDTAPNIHLPRFASGHPRRNGVVEPDHLPSLSRSSTANTAGNSSDAAEGRNSNGDGRSWIIYVLGGQYPENHPILTTPSLFTENPTYEDMMLLSALLGPAKAPVASEEDVESAGGVYDIVITSSVESNAEGATVQMSSDEVKTAELVAVATTSDDRVVLEDGQRCLVCLCDFEEKEVARKLAKCNHLFHKECIDQVSRLTPTIIHGMLKLPSG